MSTVTSVNYSKTLLGASQAAEQSYSAVREDLVAFCEKAPAKIRQFYGPGCISYVPNEQLKLAKHVLKDLDSRHKIFQSCVRKALTFPNPTDEDAGRILELLQIRKFYKISLKGLEDDSKAIEVSDQSSKEVSDQSSKKVSDQSSKKDLLQQSRLEVPKISESARANLVAIGAALKNARF